MKKLIALFLISMPCFAQDPTSTYCDAIKYDASTRFDGPVGKANDTGVATYLGRNPWPSQNIGVYKFQADNLFSMDFAGEPRHYCTRQSDNQFHWSCKMGRWFRYDIMCDF